jgi:hypothetical protein
MSDTQKVQVAPMAALTEALALSEFYRNRCLLLANEVHRLTEIMQNQAVELTLLKEAAAEVESPAETPETPTAQPIQVVKRRNPKDGAAPSVQ